MSRVLDVEANPEFETSSILRFYTSGITSLHAFFDTLYELIYASDRPSKSGIRTMQTPPTKAQLKESDPPEVYLLGSVVLLKKQLVHIATRAPRNVGIFNEEALTEELKKRGYLAECPSDIRIDPKRYWILDKEVWIKYVKKQPIQLAPVKQGNVIKLERKIS
jgi:hypothetical protein